MREPKDRGDDPYRRSRSEASDGRHFAPATARNREPILDVLRRILPNEGLVLEIGSGTGEHAVFFGEQLPSLRFQPSDPDPTGRRSIAAWIATSGVRNVLAPLALQAESATSADLGEQAAEVRAAIAFNVIHISPWTTCLGILRLASEVLPNGGPLAFYGPFRRGGNNTAPSNAAFDEMLQARDARWGVRDLDEVTNAAEQVGLSRDEVIAMPANNLVVVFRRQQRDP